MLRSQKSSDVQEYIRDAKGQLSWLFEEMGLIINFYSLTSNLGRASEG